MGGEGKSAVAVKACDEAEGARGSGGLQPHSGAVGDANTIHALSLSRVHRGTKSERRCCESFFARLQGNDHGRDTSVYRPSGEKNNCRTRVECGSQGWLAVGAGPCWCWSEGRRTCEGGEGRVRIGSRETIVRFRTASNREGGESDMGGGRYISQARGLKDGQKSRRGKEKVNGGDDLQQGSRIP